MNKKTITYHRALSFLIQEKIVSSFEKLMNTKFKNGDLLTGQTGWCDFYNDSSWGEIVSVFQKQLPVQWLKVISI